jgi:tripartite-type tricarboxylate transporter receptor subunit TctC
MFSAHRLMRNVLALFFASFCLYGLPGHAQDYPARAVHLVVPFTPGGAQDVIARLVADKLTAALSQPVVVENKAGAGGIIAAQEVAHAKPDGYTLLLSTGAQVTIAPALRRDLAYDPSHDFVHVVHLADAPLVLLANPALPVRNVRDVLDYAVAHKGQVNCASTGNGTYTHLTLELFKHITGADITHVPYKGAAPAFTDLLSGQVQLMFTSTASAQPYTSTNRLRAIAVTSSRRNAMLPEVPTFAESGVDGLDVSVWIGISAPAGTPPQAVTRLNGEVNRLLKESDMQNRLAALGTEAAGGTPAAFAAMVSTDADRWSKLIRATGIKVE